MYKLWNLVFIELLHFSTLSLIEVGISKFSLSRCPRNCLRNEFNERNLLISLTHSKSSELADHTSKLLILLCWNLRNIYISLQRRRRESWTVMTSKLCRLKNMSYSAASWKRHYCNNIDFYYLVTDFFCNKSIKVIEIAFIEIVIAFNFGHKYDLMKKVSRSRL